MSQPPIPIHQTSPLLSLPPELRNEIYTLALQHPTNSSTIEITPQGFSSPVLPLLLTCRQIRTEATPIFYTTNRFHIHICTYNSDTAHKFYALLKNLFPHSVSTRNAVQLYTHTHFLTEPSWRNLMVWLRRYHRGEVHCASKSGETLRMQGLSVLVPHVVGGMFGVVRRCRGWEWEAVERVLGVWRESLGSVDGRWMED